MLTRDKNSGYAYAGARGAVTQPWNDIAQSQLSRICLNPPLHQDTYMLPDTICIHLYTLFVAVHMCLVSATKLLPVCRPSVAWYKGIQVDRDMNRNYVAEIQSTCIPNEQLVSGNMCPSTYFYSPMYPDTSCSSGTHVAGRHVILVFLVHPASKTHWATQIHQLLLSSAASCTSSHPIPNFLSWCKRGLLFSSEIKVIVVTVAAGAAKRTSSRREIADTSRAASAWRSASGRRRRRDWWDSSGSCWSPHVLVRPNSPASSSHIIIISRRHGSLQQVPTSCVHIKYMENIT